MMRLLPVLLSGALLCACMAETVSKRKPRKGPVAEVGYVDTGGGEVRYSEDGWGWFVAGRRRDALRRTRRICRKLKPVITDEFSSEDKDVAYAGDDIEVSLQRGADHFNLAPYRHIIFECALSSVPAVSTAAAVPVPAVEPAPEAPAPAAPVVAVDTAAVVGASTAAAAALPPAVGESVQPVPAEPPIPPAPVPAAVPAPAVPLQWKPPPMVATSTAPVAVSTPTAAPAEVPKP